MMSLDLEALIHKAIGIAEKIISAERVNADLDNTLREVDNFIRLVNLVSKRASIDQESMELFRRHYHVLFSLHDKIDQYLLEQRQQLCNELKVHHKNHDAIKSYIGDR